MSRPEHGNGAVEATLQDLERNRGYVIELSSDGSQFILYCKKNTICGRISSDPDAKGFSGTITGILQRHTQSH